MAVSAPSVLTTPYHDSESYAALLHAIKAQRFGRTFLRGGRRLSSGAPPCSLCSPLPPYENGRWINTASL
jgi:hypothetical protein